MSKVEAEHQVASGSEVTVPAGDSLPATAAYAAIPEGARRGVVVVHEIFGRQPEIDAVVDRFASLGYAAVAPDLFGDGFKPFCISRAMKQLQRGEGPMIEQVRHAGAWLQTQTGLPASQVGVIGFCMGGGFALACGGGFGAVSTNYGEVPTLPEALGPTIGCYGGRDRMFRGKAALLEAKLTERGVPHEVRTYPSAGHAFLTPGRHPVAAFLTRGLLNVSWDPEVADEAWSHILTFFEKHLAVEAAQQAG